MTNDTNINNSDFWKDVKVGTIIDISCTDAIMAAMQRGAMSADAMSGLMFTVREIIRIEEMEGLCEWFLYRLGSGEVDDSWLVVRCVGEETNVALYVEADRSQFPGGNRQDILSEEYEWVFQEPEDLENFELQDLRYAQTFFWTFEDSYEGEDIEAEYKLLPFGELYGKVYQDNEDNEQIATVAEYEFDGSEDHNRAIILEIGSPECDEGGMIRLFLGESIESTEIVVMK